MIYAFLALLSSQHNSALLLRRLEKNDPNQHFMRQRRKNMKNAFSASISVDRKIVSVTRHNRCNWAAKMMFKSVINSNVFSFHFHVLFSTKFSYFLRFFFQQMRNSLRFLTKSFATILKWCHKLVRNN